MDSQSFDAIARVFARKLSRRSALKTAALGAAAAVPLRLGAASATSQASDLVVQFYENIDAYQYKDAYALLGSKWHSQQSLATFTKGYADTAFVQCTTTGEQSVSGGTRVNVKLISWHNDGKITAYTGSYVVGMENGKLTVLSGNNSLTSVPSGTPPLCKISEMGFSFGQWQGAAGSRLSAVVGVNNSSATCALGGSPRVTLTDSGGHVLRSTSEAGSPPQAIVLAPGDQAHALLRFSNWCESTGTPSSIKVELPGDSAKGSIDPATATISYPPCLGQGQASLMGIRAWLSGSA